MEGIEQLKFPVGSITASSAGLFDVYSLNNIPPGYLWAVQVLSNTYSSTGSMFLFLSGNNETLWSSNGFTSGLYYPRDYYSAKNGVLISGTTNINMTEEVIVGQLRLVGSGLGNGTSGLGINVYYHK